jgi:hypothetical protein
MTPEPWKTQGDKAGVLFLQKNHGCISKNKTFVPRGDEAGVLFLEKNHGCISKDKTLRASELALTQSVLKG